MIKYQTRLRDKMDRQLPKAPTKGEEEAMKIFEDQKEKGLAAVYTALKEADQQVRTARRELAAAKHQAEIENRPEITFAARQKYNEAVDKRFVLFKNLFEMAGVYE